MVLKNGDIVTHIYHKDLFGIVIICDREYSVRYVYTRKILQHHINRYTELKKLSNFWFKPGEQNGS